MESELWIYTCHLLCVSQYIKLTVRMLFSLQECKMNSFKSAIFDLIWTNVVSEFSKYLGEDNETFFSPQTTPSINSVISSRSIGCPQSGFINKIQASKWEKVMRGLNKWHLLLVWTVIIASQMDSLAAKLVSPFILPMAVKGGTMCLWSFLYS